MSATPLPHAATATSPHSCGEVVVLCPAKLNLALAVGAPGTDGFHPLASAMLALDWGDTLRLEKAEATQWERIWAPGAPKPGTLDWPEEQDLACRAHQLLEQTAGRTLPVKAQLAKHIPAGAGLGGGSSNAAGALVGLNQLFDLRLPPEKLEALAALLGSDVPFFVRAHHGAPLCLATGRGERLESLPMPVVWAQAWFAVVFPHSVCPTPGVYGTFDNLGQFSDPAGEGLQQVRAVAGGRAPPFNDLEAAACAVAPELDLVLSNLRGQPGIPRAQVTGSGACVFVAADNYAQAEYAACLARNAADLPTRVVRARK